MIVVSDSTPLITLMKAEKLDVLGELFGEVSIPQAVYDELTGNPNFLEEADLIQRSPIIRVVHVNNLKSVENLQRVSGLDRGESEAII